MSIKENLIKFWRFLKEDTWQSWIVSLVLAIIVIKFILFPLLSLITGSSFPLVVVQSCSMYHESSFDKWWEENGQWYESRNIAKEEFKTFSFKRGLNKGDIIIVTGYLKYNKGDIIIFNAGTQYPIIHRIVTINPTSTKGDNNQGQFSNGLESDIEDDKILGKSFIKIPLIGWIKLIFYEPFRNPKERGLCK